VEAIVALRSLRFTAAEIADTLEMALSTVSGVLRRLGLGRLSRIGLERPIRYERSRPGELVHVDVKRLGRIQGGAGKRVSGGLRKHYKYARIDAEGRRRQTVGWEFVHIAIDDHSRLAYAEVLPDEKTQTAIGFLRRARAYYARYGITIERLLTDNGPAYVSAIHALACRALGIRHLRTRPYRPQTNGKAERFIRTLLAGWAYGAVYGSSEERTRALDGWLWHYQPSTPSLSAWPPAARQQNQPARVLHLGLERRPQPYVFLELHDVDGSNREGLGASISRACVSPRWDVGDSCASRPEAGNRAVLLVDPLASTGAGQGVRQGVQSASWPDSASQDLHRRKIRGEPAQHLGAWLCWNGADLGDCSEDVALERAQRVCRPAAEPRPVSRRGDACPRTSRSYLGWHLGAA